MSIINTHTSCECHRRAPIKSHDSASRMAVPTSFHVGSTTEGLAVGASQEANDDNEGNDSRDDDAEQDRQVDASWDI